MTTSNERWVVLPHVTSETRDDAVIVHNPAAGVELVCSAGVKVVLDLVGREPISFEAIASQTGAPVAAVREMLAPLIHAVIVVPERSAAALAFGPTHPTNAAIGRSLSIDRLEHDAVPSAFVIIGAPSDAGAGMEGRPCHGPSLVRGAFPLALTAESKAGLVQDLEFRRQYRTADLPVVFDVGDVPYESGEGLDRYGGRLDYVVDKVVGAGMRPFTVGGDHSITRFTLGALLRRGGRFGVLHFDAHHDLYKGFPPRPLSHANPFAYVIDEEPLFQLVQIGLRAGFEHVAAEARPVHRPKLSWVSARECAGKSPEAILARLPRDIPWYLTFDIDVMDPVYAPETSSPEIGGLSYYQALELVDYAARHLDLVGADIVEVSGTERRTNYAARLAARFAAQILLGKTPTSPLETYVFERG